MPRPVHSARLRGFTLIEMAVTIAIVGIMVALGAGAMGRLLSIGKVNGASGNLAFAGQTARTVAISQNCPVIVRVNGSVHSGTGAVGGPGKVYVYRKKDCAATDPKYVAGDEVLHTLPIPGVTVSTEMGAADNLATLLVYSAGVGGLSVWQGTSTFTDKSKTALKVTCTSKDAVSTKNVQFISGGGPKVVP